MKKELSTIKTKFGKLAVGAYCFGMTTAASAMSVMADGGELGELGKKVDGAKDVMYTLLGFAGGIVFAISLVKCFQAHKNGDDRAMDGGIAGCIFGLVLSSFGIIMQAIGI